MYGRTPSQAITRYVQTLQRAIDCITNEIVRAGGFQAGDAPHALVLARGGVVRLAGGAPLVGLRMRQHYTASERRTAGSRDRWQVVVTEYSYTILDVETDRELLAFHWHPHVPVSAFPHLHLESGLDVRADFVGMHVPSGRVSLEDIVRFLIREFGVQPRRTDWAQVLDETEAALQAV